MAISPLPTLSLASISRRPHAVIVVVRELAHRRRSFLQERNPLFGVHRSNCLTLIAASRHRRRTPGQDGGALTAAVTATPPHTEPTRPTTTPRFAEP
jgi:hypothetical protein